MSEDDIIESFEQHELESVLWQKISRIMRQRRQEHYRANAQPSVDHDATQLIRGRIAELNYFIDMDEAPMRVDESPYEELPESSDPSLLV
jgi:hypothetical protein